MSLPVTSQPRRKVSVAWMEVPITGISGCPPGLECLSQLDQLQIREEVHMEVRLAWECANKYRVLNNLQQQVFYALEESDPIMRQCCCSKRSFVLHITDNEHQEILRFCRDYKCCGGCCCCAMNECAAHVLTVTTGQGEILGYVRQIYSRWRGHFAIMDEKQLPIMEIWSPCCPCQGVCCTADVEFPVFSVEDGSIRAKISKEWAGATQELFTDADNFTVHFPRDLDVKIKAVLLGAVFLIDFMFFDHKENQKDI